MGRAPDLWNVADLVVDLHKANFYDDSKEFVDLPIKSSPAEVRRTYRDEVAISKHPNAIQDFLSQNFEAAGSDLDSHVPGDFHPNPARFLPDLCDEAVRKWALELHHLWPKLCRKVGGRVHVHPERHSLLSLPHPFFIPGQRFRELYYWDSYWVIKGLLVSGMHRSAEAIVRNLLYLLQEHGHVPNGSRTYYLNRSQPPLLSSMVGLLYKAERDVLFLQEAFEALQTEYAYWTQPPKAVRLTMPDGSTATLSRYYADTVQPRPESFREDMATAAQRGGGQVERECLFRDIASAAESGWDFSSRWMADGSSLASLRTTLVVPADLNAFLFKMECDMARFAEILGEVQLEAKFRVASEARCLTMNALMWNESAACWKDLILEHDPATDAEQAAPVRADHAVQGVFASCYVPLWAGVAAAESEQATRCLNSLQASGLIQPGGIATSLSETGQQWDGCNAWPPLQAMLTEAAEAIGRAQMRACSGGRLLAQVWLETCFAAWRKHGQMFEKYNARVPGDPGGDGEYPVQAGFGWSNGVALAFLAEFGWNP